MYKIDEYVVHMTGGICRVDDISPLAISGADKDKKYYLLMPVSTKGSKVYVPVDNDTAIRKICTTAEAEALIKEIPSIDELTVDNEKLREAKYKEIIKGCNLRDYVSILKNLSTRRMNRLKEGKKNTATDEKYFKIASENLFSELSFVLGKEKDEVKQLILNMMTV